MERPDPDEYTPPVVPVRDTEDIPPFGQKGLPVYDITAVGTWVITTVVVAVTVGQAEVAARV